MDIDHIASLLNEISMRLDRIPAWSASNGSRPYEYVHIEAVAMDGALEMAEEFPGFEWDIWKSIAESFQVMTLRFARTGHRNSSSSNTRRSWRSSRKVIFRPSHDGSVRSASGSDLTDI